MSDVVNLNKTRKKKLREDKEKRAAENRARFGRTKAEKMRDRMERETLAKHVEGHSTKDRGED